MKRSPLISLALLERIVDASEEGIVVAEQEGLATIRKARHGLD